MTHRQSPGFGRSFMLLLAGPLIWFAHFSLIYGARGFGGAFGFTSGGIRTFAWAATLIAAAAIVALYVYVQKRRMSSGSETATALAQMTRWLAILSFGAVLLQLLVLSIVPR